METKLFELRDKGTFIPIACMSCESDADQERWLLRRAGFGPDNRLIQLISFNRKQTAYDCYDWSDRTYQTAHRYIQKNWDSLKNGQVIDVEFILEETDEPKTSERVFE